MFRDGPQIRVPPGAPEQHRREQGIVRRLFPAHGPDQLKTQAALLEPLVPAAAQGHAGQKGNGLYHSPLLTGGREDFPSLSLE